MALNDQTAQAAAALESSARSFTRHTGPDAAEDERAVFSRDLLASALRYARAYYAEAREYGLIPEYERKGAV